MKFASLSNSKRVQGWMLSLLAVLLVSPATVGAGGTGGGNNSSGPVIVDFGAIDNGQGVWTFEGQVMDPNPGSCTVYLGGLPSLKGQTVPCDVSGYFSIDIPLTASDDGTATAQAVDGQGLLSSIVYTNVTDPN